MPRIKLDDPFCESPPPFAKVFHPRIIPIAPAPRRMQQCASVLLPILFTTITVIVCAAVALALLTDGFSYCNVGNSVPPEPRDDTCLTRECILQSGYIMRGLDDSADPCSDFEQYACGNTVYSNLTEIEFESQLKGILEQKPRPSYPPPYRLIYDLYDSCIQENYLDQLDLTAFNGFVSRLGGWALLQNAKFDNATQSWEELEANLNEYGIDAVFRIENDTITYPDFLQAKYDRGDLNEYFLALMEELDIDPNIGQTVIERSFQLDSALQNAAKIQDEDKVKIRDLRTTYPNINWPALGLQMVPTHYITIPPAYVDAVNAIQNPEDLVNYQMMKMLYEVDLHLPRKYRRHHEKLVDDSRPRWKKCLQHLREFLPVPLIQFSRKIMHLTSESAMAKKLVRKRIWKCDWMDEESKEMGRNNLLKWKVVTAGQGVDTSNAYKGERLDPSSHFDNVIMLRHINKREGTTLGRRTAQLLTTTDPLVVQHPPHIVFGPLAQRHFASLSPSNRRVQLMRLAYRIAFDSGTFLHTDYTCAESVQHWAPETQTILQAKVHCYTMNNVTTPRSVAFQSAALEMAGREEKRANMEDAKRQQRLPGLMSYSRQQLLYLYYAVDSCTDRDRRASVNNVLQHLDGFADAFGCAVGSGMSPREKCSLC